MSGSGRAASGNTVVVWSTGGVGSNAIRADRPPSRPRPRRRVGPLAREGRPRRRRARGHRPARRHGHRRRRCAASRSSPTASSTPRAGRSAAPERCPTTSVCSSAGINVVTTTSTELVFPPAADAALRDRLRGGGRGGWCVALRVGDLPRVRVRRAGGPAHHDVAEHPDPAAHRGLAERPLPGRRRDDGRARLRSCPRLRAVHRPRRGSSR